MSNSSRMETDLNSSGTKLVRRLVNTAEYFKRGDRTAGLDWNDWWGGVSVLLQQPFQVELNKGYSINALVQLGWIKKCVLNYYAKSKKHKEQQKLKQMPSLQTAEHHFLPQKLRNTI